MKGVENIFKAGVEYGARLSLDNSQAPQNINASNVFGLEDEKNDNK